MCRFIIYDGPDSLISPLIFQASHSLVYQSHSAEQARRPVNADGFGIGWYPTHDDQEPATFVNIDPAWSNRNLRMITNKVITGHYFAHVRDASPNMPVNQASCHPFRLGKYLWMHNGQLDQFEKIRRPLRSSLTDAAYFMICGNTDSEHAFGLFMDILDHNPAASSEELEAAMVETLRQIMQLRNQQGATSCSSMNFAVTDGETTIATRFSTHGEVAAPSLYYGEGMYQEQGGEITFANPPDASQRCAIICSEPLTEEMDHWHPVANNHLVRIDKNKQLSCQPILLPSQQAL